MTPDDQRILNVLSTLKNIARTIPEQVSVLESLVSDSSTSPSLAGFEQDRDRLIQAMLKVLGHSIRQVNNLFQEVSGFLHWSPPALPSPRAGQSDQSLEDR